MTIRSVHTDDTSLLQRPWFAVATDSFLSGWGHAEGGRSLYVVACESLAEANEVAGRMRTRSDFKRVRVQTNLPRTRDRDHLRLVGASDFTYQPNR